MSFSEAVRTCLSKSFVWRGRASRAEFWYLFLAVFLAEFAAGLVAKLPYVHIIGMLAGPLIGLASIFPLLAVQIRRLHDTNRSGGWYFIILIPLAGPLILLGLALLPGTPYDNPYGPSPLGTRPAPYDPATSGPIRDAHWCATPDCPMYRTNVGQELCYSCDNPTRGSPPE